MNESIRRNLFKCKFKVVRLTNSPPPPEKTENTTNKQKTKKAHKHETNASFKRFVVSLFKYFIFCVY